MKIRNSNEDAVRREVHTTSIYPGLEGSGFRVQGLGFRVLGRVAGAKLVVI